MPALIGTSPAKLLAGEVPLSRLYAGTTLAWEQTIADPLAFVPAEDRPVVTYAAVGASVAPTIAGSPGWLREKRVGVAEGAAGAAQSSTAALDLTGSTRFAYPMLPAAVGHASNAGNYVQSNFKEGSTSSVQNARYLFPVDFMTDAPVVQIRLRAPSSSPLLGRVLINGLRMQRGSVASSGGDTIAAGNGYGAVLTFPDARTRRITIYGLNVQDGSFGGVAVGAGYSVWKPTSFGTIRLAVLGDSFTNGAGSFSAGGARAMETWPWELGLLLGTGMILQAGIGASGLMAPSDASAPLTVFRNRVPTIMSTNPTHVIVMPGRNDQNYTAGQEQAELEYVLDQIGTTPKRYVTRSSINGQAINAGISAGAASRGVPYLDLDTNAIPKIADGIHPTYPGHESIAAQMNTFMRSAGL